MDLLALAMSLALPFGPGGFSGDYTFNVSPTFSAPTSMYDGTNVLATSLPGLVLHREDITPENRPDVFRHELVHRDQQDALGGAFPVAYALSGGRPFESYDPMSEILGLPPAFEHRGMDMSQAWQPTEEQKGQFPLFRVSRQGDRTSAELLPGYPRFIDLKPR